MHRAIALKLQQQPELLEIARTHLLHWLGRDGRSTPYLTAWRNILNQPPETLLQTIQEDSERMATMRQNTPLAGLLSAGERWRIYAAIPAEPSLPAGPLP